MTSAAWHAERALLGAVVRRPELAVGEAVPTSEDFTDPEHAAVWAAVRGLQREARRMPGPADVALAPAAVGRVLENAAVVAEALMSRRFDTTEVVNPSRLMHELIRVAPSTLFEVALYERIVREAAVRRRVEEMGLRPAPADADRTRNISATNLTSQEIADRKRALSDVYRSARAQTARHSHLGVSEASGPADPTSSLPERLVVRQERVLIRTMLIDATARNEGLVELFQPGDFLSAEHVSTWWAMQVVSERGELITPITVAWESEKLSRSVLSVADLTTLTREPPGDRAQATVVVARAAWTRYHSVHGLYGARSSEDTMPQVIAAGVPHSVPVDGARRRAATAQDPAVAAFRGWVLPEHVPSQEPTR